VALKCAKNFFSDLVFHGKILLAGFEVCLSFCELLTNNR